MLFEFSRHSIPALLREKNRLIFFRSRRECKQSQFPRGQKVGQKAKNTSNRKIAKIRTRKALKAMCVMCRRASGWWQDLIKANPLLKSNPCQQFFSVEKIVDGLEKSDIIESVARKSVSEFIIEQNRRLSLEENKNNN